MTLSQLSKPNASWGTGVCLASLICATCCTGSGGSGPAPGSERAPTERPQAAAGQQPRPAEVQATTRRALPPLRLELRGEEVEGRSTQVTATLTRSGRLPGPVTLKVRFPEGAALEQGLAEEVLPREDLDRDLQVVRVFRVANRGPGAIQVTAEVSARGYGARAEAVYPPTAPEPAEQQVKSQPMSPVKVKGVTLQESVPIEAN